MTELFYEGYSEYELEALKIPIDARGKCLKQLVDFTKCFQKASVFSNIISQPCQDENARFSRCHQRSVDYYSGGHLALMKYNNSSAFTELKVSPTLEAEHYNPTFVNYHS